MVEEAKQSIEEAVGGTIQSVVPKELITETPTGTKHLLQLISLHLLALPTKMAYNDSHIVLGFLTIFM